MSRRLAAILIADIVGYSRLSQIDEEGTRARFVGELKSIFDPYITAHHGRLVKTMGDALLIEFPSAVDAVRCAVAIQRAKLAAANEEPAGLGLQYRIGINLGDVVIEGDDIHGEGVNIAARLQTLAEPGGIAVSGVTFDQVKYRADIGYAYLGEQQVKNIAEPIRVYRVLLDPSDVGKTIAPAPAKSAGWKTGVVIAAGIAAVAAAIGIAVTAPWQLLEDTATTLPSPPSDRPAIAVLPFESLSSDPTQAYFADGLTDDIITDLSRLSGLFVVARNSSFALKDLKLPVREVAERLGVRYILDGSVRYAGDEVRINAQLTDTGTDAELWADRYDGTTADVFALQDKVSRSVVSALSVELSDSEHSALTEAETNAPTAYNEFLRGWHHRERTSPAEFVKAIPHFENAIRLDPGYGRAYAALALVYLRSYQRGWAKQLGLTDEEALARAKSYSEQADSYPSAIAHQVSGLLAITENSLTQGIQQFEKAISLDPGDSWNFAYLSLAESLMGNSERALASIDAALRLDPIAPPLFHYYRALALFGEQDYPAAAENAKIATDKNPDDQVPFLLLAASLGQMGRVDEAGSALERYDELVTKYGGRIATASSLDGLLKFQRVEDRDRLLDGLRKAGLPES
jgi:TolB-like protein/class 3 adenylate cyclase/Flp pilus assembly protein TadD